MKRSGKHKFRKIVTMFIMYIALICGSGLLGVGIVHFIFSDDDQVISVQKNTLQDSDESKTVKTEGSSNEVSKDEEESPVIAEPTWEPIGTSQSEPHRTIYDQSSVDWQEMKKAISLAAEVEVDQMTVWWIGSDGGENRSFGIVSPKGSKNYVRVAIQWVTNKGWKPTSLRVVNDEEYNKYIKKYVEKSE
jgi:hypothetical protein